MSAIRPDLPAFPQAVPARPDAARAAQSAFFRAALEQVQARQPAPATPAPPITSAPAEAHRPMRPGSLLDIKV